MLSVSAASKEAAAQGQAGWGARQGRGQRRAARPQRGPLLTGGRRRNVETLLKCTAERPEPAPRSAVMQAPAGRTTSLACSRWGDVWDMWEYEDLSSVNSYWN